MKLITFGYALNKDKSRQSTCLVPAMLSNNKQLSELEWIDTIYPKNIQNMGLRPTSMLVLYMQQWLTSSQNRVNLITTL